MIIQVVGVGVHAWGRVWVSVLGPGTVVVVVVSRGRGIVCLQECGKDSWESPERVLIQRTVMKVLM